MDELLRRIWDAWNDNRPVEMAPPGDPPETLRQIVEAITGGEDFVLVFARELRASVDVVEVRTGVSMRVDPRNPLRRARHIASLLGACAQQVEYAREYYGDWVDIGVLPIAGPATGGPEKQN